MSGPKFHIILGLKGLLVGFWFGLIGLYVGFWVGFSNPEWGLPKSSLLGRKGVHILL